MTGAATAPHTRKGAIVGMDRYNPLASVVVFQYNPDKITRKLEARTPQASRSEASARDEALRLAGPPSEVITVEIEVDAADQQGGARSGVGLHAPLSALELLLYPKSAFVAKNLASMLAGSTTIIPAAAPLTLFVWGLKRVLPVRITQMTITEEAHDTLLNPVRAKVDLSMNVLSYHDLKPDNPGWAMFMAHQAVKELFATANTAWSLANAGESLKVL